MSSTSLPGFRDFYPAELAERAHIFRAWRDVARRFAFTEYDGPPLEPLELYTKKSGDEIVGQLYSFTDRGDRLVALRPEMTPTFARMVAARANSLRKPVRWFSLPQLFRYERQQKGRLREHFQLNVDIVGEADVIADAELLAVAIEIMRELGLTAEDVRARVSDRRLLLGVIAALGVAPEAVPAVFAAVDKVEREARPALERKLREAGVDGMVAGRLLEIAATSDFGGLRTEFGSVPGVEEVFSQFDRYLRYLEAHGVAEWIRFDLSIVRGLAYYTGIVFELFDARGEFRAICGGGRYDKLLESLGGVDLPALGFGMGDVVLGELVKARGLMPAPSAELEFWVAAAEGAAVASVLRVAAELRRRGSSVDYTLNAHKLTTQKLSAQLRAANTAGARHAVIVLDESLAEMRSLRDEREPRRFALSDFFGGMPLNSAA